jgi:hypothetical protein
LPTQTHCDFPPLFPFRSRAMLRHAPAPLPHPAPPLRLAGLCNRVAMLWRLGRPPCALADAAQSRHHLRGLAEAPPLQAVRKIEACACLSGPGPPPDGALWPYGELGDGARAAGVEMTVVGRSNDNLVDVIPGLGIARARRYPDHALSQEASRSFPRSGCCRRTTTGSH